MAKKHANGSAASSSAGAALSSPASPSSASDASTARSRREAQAAHVRALDAALDRPGGVDLPALRALSLHGFVNDERRRRVWPLLLGVDVAELDAQASACALALAASPSASSASVQPLPHDYYSGLIYRHKYFDQIEKDIARSLCHFEGNRGWKERKRVEARLALARMMHTLFSLHADLHYVQGFHDIASVFLLVCNAPLDASDPFGSRSNAQGEELAFMLTERLALLHLRDSLRPTLDTVVEVMSLIFPLLAEADPEVFAFLRRTQVQSFFSLSWILTWFSHNLSREADVARVFDFFLSSHPLQPVYATVALIVQMRTGLLQLESKAVEEARARWEEEHAPAAAVAAPAASTVAAATEEGLRKRNNQSGGEGSAAENTGSDSSSSHDSSSAAASSTADVSSATAASSPPPFDPSLITVEMSAVHAYFQHLPPVLNLDELFARTSALAAANPPRALLRSGGGLAIPSDSPLLLDEPAADLPRKLTNYLEWKRRTKRVNNTRQMPNNNAAAVSSASTAAAGASSAVSAGPAADASSAMGHDALGRHIGPLDSAGLPLYPATAPRSATDGGLIDPTKVASSFYAYPSAKSSRAALIRFAIMGRARMLRERAANAWKNRGKPKPRARGSQAASKSWFTLPRLTRKGRFAVAGVLFAVATVMLAVYLPASNVLDAFLRPAASIEGASGVQHQPQVPEIIFAAPPAAAAAAASSPSPASAVPAAASASVPTASAVAAAVVD